MKELLVRLMIYAGFRLELEAFRLDPDAAMEQTEHEFALDSRTWTQLYEDSKSA